MSTSAAQIMAASPRRAIALVSGAHFLSHFYLLLLPPLFPILVTVYDVGFTELAPDGLDLLPEQVLALRARHLLLDHGRDLFFDPDHLVLTVHLVQHPADALADVERFEHCLFGIVAEGKIRCDEVGKGSGLANVV